jgi:hypothetical protein
MEFFKRLFMSSKRKGGASSNENAGLYFFINMNKDVYGPFSLLELKNDYPILKDTLITTDTLNGEWYEAQCFECFDELFDSQQDFTITEDGTIIRRKQKK